MQIARKILLNLFSLQWSVETRNLRLLVSCPHTGPHLTRLPQQPALPALRSVWELTQLPQPPGSTGHPPGVPTVTTPHHNYVQPGAQVQVTAKFFPFAHLTLAAAVRWGVAGSGVPGGCWLSHPSPHCVQSIRSPGRTRPERRTLNTDRPAGGHIG